ncbi:hypothetical protein J2789_002980 [Variovorax paradoxus]|uniref:hypothetical protein n=1 Tax=Variovorax atrisoli TaxID=3394203 RepID=UPI001198E693|nr:hypothetical protein [Variovorax paradoxus]MDR6520295.1 hypothetical protein [Variovorax paradoxus]
MSGVLRDPAFIEKVLLALLDKGALAIILVAVGLWANQKLESFKADIRIAELAQRDKVELQKQLEATRRDIELKFRERQLSMFFWPLYLRLEKDSAIWQRVATISNDGRRALPADASGIIERDVLKNHEEMVKVIEANIHLAGTDPDLLKDLLKYMEHVAVYQAMRSAGVRLNPIDVGAEFPPNLTSRIKAHLERLQREYSELTARGGTDTTASTAPSHPATR